jgi:hypothetical protein
MYTSSAMTIRISIILLLAACVVAQNRPAVNAATPEKQVNTSPAMMKALGNYGGWWNSLSDQAKDNFIDGYTSAMDKAKSMTDGFGKQAKERLTPGPSFDAQMDHAMLLFFLSSEFSYDNSNNALRDALNEFYKDPLNTRIKISLAMGHVRDQLEGRKTAGQLLDELNDWRKIVNGNPH